MPFDFQRWLWETMTRRPLTLQGIADGAGVQVATVITWLTTDQRPGRAALARFALYLDIPVSQVRPFMTPRPPEGYRAAPKRLWYAQQKANRLARQLRKA